jgi:hypothetical protein
VGEAAGSRSGATLHEGFLRHARMRWLKVALLLAVLAFVGYLAASVPDVPYGGTWYGYTLGTIGALLILWLTALGLRKRVMTRGRWSLKAWTSAHVYLGLSLVAVATLHTGFRLGWNIHTLAYALMMLVVLSGLSGVVVYSVLPAQLSANGSDMTQAQMIEGLRALDRQLLDAAQPLETRLSQAVLAAVGETPLKLGLRGRLAGGPRRSLNQAALDAIGRYSRTAGNNAPERVEKLLERRRSALDRIYRHMRLRALLEVWLFVHVPATIALLAALVAHIVSVFYYW